MALLTVPSGDGADMRSRQDVQALSASSGDLKGRLEPDSERAKPMHGVMHAERIAAHHTKSL
jgi:hypothetical protein